MLPLPDRSGAIETSAAWLATDQNWTGKGVGTGLLAAQRCVAALIGGRALIVNAVDVDAAAFWRRRGFIP